MFKRVVYYCWAILAITVALMTVPVAHAAGIDVNDPGVAIANDGKCTLREAIAAANSNTVSGLAVGECAAGGATDTITLPAGIITLAAGGALTLSDGVSITGMGQNSTFIDASALTGVDKFLTVGKNATLKDFTIKANSITPRYGIQIGSNHSAPNNVTIQNVTVDSFARTGLNLNAAVSVTLTNVIVKNNGGAGIAMLDSLNVTLNNVTTTNNAWGGVGIFTRDYACNGTPRATDNIVFTGVNNFGESGTVVSTSFGPVNPAGVYLEGWDKATVNACPGSICNITWSVNGNAAMVKLQSADVQYGVSGNSTDQKCTPTSTTIANYKYVQLYKTEANALSAVQNYPGAPHIDLGVARVITDGLAPLQSIYGGSPDKDDVSDAMEDGAPNGGDGNGDGIADKTQSNVASLLDLPGTSYVTLVTSLGQFRNVKAVPVPSGKPAGVNFGHGLVQFDIVGLTVGQAATVKITFHSGDTPISYWKYGKSGWSSFEHNGTTGATIAGRTVTLSFIDGQRGDDDGLANGTIIDPSGSGGAGAVGGVSQFIEPRVVSSSWFDKQNLLISVMLVGLSGILFLFITKNSR